MYNFFLVFRDIFVRSRWKFFGYVIGLLVSYDEIKFKFRLYLVIDCLYFCIGCIVIFCYSVIVVVVVIIIGVECGEFWLVCDVVVC